MARWRKGEQRSVSDGAMAGRNRGLSKVAADGNSLNQDYQDFRIFRIGVSIWSILES